MGYCFSLHICRVIATDHSMQYVYITRLLYIAVHSYTDLYGLPTVLSSLLERTFWTIKVRKKRSLHHSN